MQRTADTLERSTLVLFERIRTNRLILQNNTERLATALTTAQQRRLAVERLRAEVRRSREQLRRSRESLLAQRPPLRPAPMVPRHPDQADPADGIRQQLHEAYAASRDPALRDELLSSYDGFARSLALKFRHRDAVDDLVQVARIGLLHAIDRFDPELGRPFPLFARITITGELKRHIRDRTWAMRVSRSLQEDYLNVMRAVDELTAVRSDSPTMEALAEHCGMPVERVVEALELRVSQRALSIDAPAGAAGDDPVIELGREDLGFRQLENRELLNRLFEPPPRAGPPHRRTPIPRGDDPVGDRRRGRGQPDVRLPGPGPHPRSATALGPQRRRVISRPRLPWSG